MNSQPTHRGADATSHRLLAIVEEAQNVDVRSYERVSAESAHEGLRSPMLATLDAATEFCQRTLKSYDGPAPVELLRARKCVADLAFMGTMALTPKRAAIEHLSASHDLWEIVSECGSARRRIIKTLTALETALAELEGRSPRLAHASGLARSLETRRRYTQLRRTIVREDFSAHRAVPILRKVGTAIAILVGRDIYPEFRIPDRRQLRSLQTRILNWLRHRDENANALQVGRRLHQDLVMFADLIGQVRRRQELVEHDISALRQLLNNPTFLALPPGAADELLASLAGLDDDLDAILFGTSSNRETWLPILCRVFEATRGAKDNPCDGPCASVAGVRRY